MTPRIKHAFRSAQMIRAMMEELVTDIEAIARDESISPEARHLCIEQICSLWSIPGKILSDYARDFLDNNVPKGRNLIVEGFNVDDLYIAGKVYDCAPKAKIEILNKDDRSWGSLMRTLADNNFSRVVQQRLTPSYFTGPQGKDLLKVCGGLVTIIEDSSWSIKKPTASKSKKR